MTLQEILFIARSRLRDFGLKRWTDPELVAAANAAQSRLAHIFRQSREDWFLTSTISTIPVAAAPNASEITLPSDFWELKDLEISTAGYEDIVFMARDRSTQQFHDSLANGGSFASGSGICFYDISAGTTLSTLRLSPGFDVAMPLRITYIKLLTDMALPSDEPGFPSEFHDFLPQYVVCEALRSAGDPRLIAYEADMKEETDVIKNALHPRQIKEMRYVTGYLEQEEW